MHNFNNDKKKKQKLEKKIDIPPSETISADEIQEVSKTSLQKNIDLLEKI
jgi:hypothetical protein